MFKFKFISMLVLGLFAASFRTTYCATSVASGSINANTLTVTHTPGFFPKDLSQVTLTLVMSGNNTTEWRVSYYFDTTMTIYYPLGSETDIIRTDPYLADLIAPHRFYHTMNAWLEHRGDDTGGQWVTDGYVYRTAVCNN